MAAVPTMAQVVLQAGNSPQMISGHYRELVRVMDAKRGLASRAYLQLLTLLQWVLRDAKAEAFQYETGSCGT